jgi:glyoxylase-like metal-dependent hydrolase (beta-lactamase superfamily II)
MAASAASAGPVAAEPAAQVFTLGALKLIALRDAFYVAPNDGKTFGTDVGPAAVAEVLRAAGAPTDRITVAVDALLVEMPGRRLLLDTGLGSGAHGVLMASLAKSGIAPGSITDVLITHTHGDHVGGLVTKSGALAFPGAAIRMSAREWAWMKSADGNPELAAQIAAKVKTFEPGEAIAPGVTPIAIDGHTPGHVGYEIASGGARLLDIGDTAHSSIVSLARPGWGMGFDGDKALGRESRIQTLTRLARSHELVFAPHFPFPGVGRVVPAGEGFAWAPGLK